MSIPINIYHLEGLLVIQELKLLCIRVLQRNRTNKETYYKALIHTTLASQKSCNLTFQAGDPGNPVVSFQSKYEGLRIRRTDGVSSSL